MDIPLVVKDIIDDLINFTRKHPQVVKKTMIINFVDEQFDTSVVSYRYYRRLHRLQSMERKMNACEKRIINEQNRLHKLSIDKHEYETKMELPDQKEPPSSVFTTQEQLDSYHLKELEYMKETSKLKDKIRILEETLIPKREEELKMLDITLSELFGSTKTKKEALITEKTGIEPIKLDISVVCDQETIESYAILETIDDNEMKDVKSMKLVPLVKRHILVEKKMNKLMGRLQGIFDNHLGKEIGDELREVRSKEGRATSIIKGIECLIELNVMHINKQMKQLGSNYNPIAAMYKICRRKDLII